MAKPRKNASKKPVKRRTDIPRPYCNGNWTVAGFQNFVRSALRKAPWPPKYRAVEAAFVGNGINPATGRQCKLHRCETCLGLFPQNGVQADHIVPVVGPEGFQSWDLYIQRLFVDSSGFRILCKKCHKEVTEKERIGRQFEKLLFD